jgi:hypothetical protein
MKLNIYPAGHSHLQQRANISQSQMDQCSEDEGIHTMIVQIKVEARGTCGESSLID